MIHPVRIVIADDDRYIRKSLKMLLLTEGDLEVVGEAEDGLEALALTERLDPDLVLIDVQMPRMCGIEATRIIKQRNPRTGVIVLSVYDTARGEARSAGADGFLLKDCGRPQLIATVKEWVSAVPAPLQ